MTPDRYRKQSLVTEIGEEGQSRIGVRLKLSLDGLLI